VLRQEEGVRRWLVHRGVRCQRGGSRGGGKVSGSKRRNSTGIKVNWGPKDLQRGEKKKKNQKSAQLSHRNRIVQKKEGTTGPRRYLALIDGKRRKKKKKQKNKRHKKHGSKKLRDTRVKKLATKRKGTFPGRLAHVRWNEKDQQKQVDLETMKFRKRSDKQKRTSARIKVQGREVYMKNGRRPSNGLKEITENSSGGGERSKNSILTNGKRTIRPKSTAPRQKMNGTSTKKRQTSKPARGGKTKKKKQTITPALQYTGGGRKQIEKHGFTDNVKHDEEKGVTPLRRKKTGTKLEIEKRCSCQQTRQKITQ